jgi:hypothetical protein
LAAACLDGSIDVWNVDQMLMQIEDVSAASLYAEAERATRLTVTVTAAGVVKIQPATT